MPNIIRGPAVLRTERLILRRPRASDATSMFERYASDLEVTRLVGWPRHTSISDTEAFLAFTESEWHERPAGAYLIECRTTGALLGSTGFGFESAQRAATGYVLARDSWGRGYATEALRAIAQLAPQIGVRRLYALCHAEHRASAHVLEKCGFVLEGVLRNYTEFPNLTPGEPCDVQCWASVF